MRMLVVTALVSALVPLTAAPAFPTTHVGSFWRWSDGSQARMRTLSEHRYLGGSRLPDLIVSTDPAAPGRRVALQFRDSHGWRTDDVATTDGRGVARLEVNPYCEDGAWCRRAYEYRLVSGEATAALTLRFTP